MRAAVGRGGEPPTLEEEASGDSEPKGSKYEVLSESGYAMSKSAAAEGSIPQWAGSEWTSSLGTTTHEHRFWASDLGSG